MRSVLRILAAACAAVGAVAVVGWSASSFLSASAELRASSPMQLDKKVGLAGPYGALANATDLPAAPRYAGVLFEPKILGLNGEPKFEASPQPAVGPAPMVVEHPQIASAVPLPPARPLPAPEIQPPRPATPQVAAVAPPVRSEPRSARPQTRNEVAELIGADSRTAVYDISARTVYLPSGRRLEAHSGLGDKMDNPRYVSAKNRGPTPPNVYELKLREQLFHGVRAIRMTPVDDRKMYGRDGILAHSYMLGPNGQSNGCVSFDDYPAFLHAFLKGEVERMVVVARLPTPPSGALMSSRARDNRYAANNS